MSSRHWSNVFDIEKKRDDLKILTKELENPVIWQKREVALAKQQEISRTEETIEKFDKLKKSADDLQELANYFSTGQEEKNFEQELGLLQEAVWQQIEKAFLSGKYDSLSAIMVIQSGTGGRDAEDWAALLLRMYQRFCEEKKWPYQVLSQSFTEAGGPEGRIGIKEVALAIKGEFAYGLLKKEMGVHRLVRISPFSAKKLRHTSFAQVEVMPQLLNKTAGIILKPEDLKIETFRSAGHGGQNVNKRETAVRITHLPTGIVASSQIERTQAMNRKIAMDFLLSKIIAKEDFQRQQELQDERFKMRQGIGRGKKLTADFGQQIRSYVLHPYKLVKDHRTNVETSNVEAVLNGALDIFIEAEIRI